MTPSIAWLNVTSPHANRLLSRHGLAGISQRRAVAISSKKSIRELIAGGLLAARAAISSISIHGVPAELGSAAYACIG